MSARAVIKAFQRRREARDERRKRETVQSNPATTRYQKGYRIKLQRLKPKRLPEQVYKDPEAPNIGQQRRTSPRDCQSKSSSAHPSSNDRPAKIKWVRLIKCAPPPPRYQGHRSNPAFTAHIRHRRGSPPRASNHTDQATARASRHDQQTAKHRSIQRSGEQASSREVDKSSR